MTVQKSRETLNRDEIVDIVRANTELFREEGEFANFITDLVIYLVENHYDRLIEKRRQLEGGESMAQAAKADEALEQLKIPKELTDTQAHNLTKRYQTLRTVSKQVKDEANCPSCGARVQAGRRCMVCGAMAT